MVEFEANHRKYTMAYYLADEIYPAWDRFVKPILNPQRNKRGHFVKAQATARKNVERAFGVLQA